MKPWENKIRKVVPYIPGEQPQSSDVIKLNTNENPYPPAPGVQKVLDEFKTEKLRLYPDTMSNGLTAELAKFYKRSPEEIFVGVGSDDVLAVAFLTFFNSEKPILFPNITYSFYEVWADLYKIPYRTPKLTEDFKIRKEDYYEENGGVIFANPNAPTSIVEPLSFVEDILEHNQDVIVIVDEAYIDFGGESAISLIDKYENLLVVQTFSKSRSMAGMRIGYAVGNKALIKAMNDVKFSINSYTMNLTSQVAGIEAVKDVAYFEEHVAKIVKDREWSKKQLEEMGFLCMESSTNFLFATHPKKPAKELFEALKEKNIFVRYFGKEEISNYLRITIGTRAQMETLIETIRGLLA